MIGGKAAQHRTRVRDVEDDGMEVEVENLLAEPRLDRVSVDDFFHEDMTLDVNINAEFFDKDSESEDIDQEGSIFEKASSGTHSFGYSGSGSSTVGVSESPSTSIGKPRFKNGINDHVTLCKLHGVPNSKCNCQDQRKEKTEPKILILYTSQNRRKLQSRLALLSPVTNETGLTSFSNLHWASEDAMLVSNPKKTNHLLSDRHGLERFGDGERDNPIKITTETSLHKRLRKPPVRYIDEFSSFVASDEKHSISGKSTPRNKILKGRMSSEHNNGRKAFRSFKHAQTPDKPSASDRVVCALSKEFSPVTRLDSDEETDSDIPDDHSLSRNGSKKYGDRRKHQKVWILPEVVKLVDGISHYGVGRWTEIQRLFFPSSTYRTPVDLRDKWRNLLKASEAWMQNDQEEQGQDESQKNGHRQLPKEILHRISELGRLHPYPVKRKPSHLPAHKSKRASSSK